MATEQNPTRSRPAPAFELEPPQPLKPARQKRQKRRASRRRDPRQMELGLLVPGGGAHGEL